MRVFILLSILFVVSSPLIFTQTQGNDFGFQFGAGISGSLSYFEVGVMLPKISDKVFVDLKARFMSAITWTTFVNMET